MRQDIVSPPGLIARAEDEDARIANEEHRAGNGTTREGLEHYRKAGQALNRAKVKAGHGGWLAWQKRWLDYGSTQACAYMKLAAWWDEASPKFSAGENLTGALKIIDKLNKGEPDTEEEEAEASGNSKLGADGEAVTLDRWEAMSEDERDTVLAVRGDRKFNAQGESEGIQWALWSWNPVTGCRHSCPYCYARDIANRFYEIGFEPALWPGRLQAPENTPYPEAKIQAETDPVRKLGLGNVFTCSMADLFGRWVPSEWIDLVLDAARAAPQWNFLFLSKFPQRMADFDFPDNAWVGTSVDQQARVANAEKAFRKIKASVKWLSCEPLIEPLRFSDLGAFDWIVLGGASAGSQTPEWKPPHSWIHAIMADAKAAGVEVYQKPNLLAPQQGYPTLPYVEPTQAPEPLRYLPEAHKP